MNENYEPEHTLHALERQSDSKNDPFKIASTIDCVCTYVSWKESDVFLLGYCKLKGDVQEALNSKLPLQVVILDSFIP